MPKEQRTEDPRIGIRSDTETVEALAKIGREIDRDQTYVVRALLAHGIEKFAKDPHKLTAFVLRQKRKKAKA